MPTDTRSHVVGRALFAVMDRLTADGGARLSETTLDDLGYSLWAPEGGWVRVSIETGWRHALYLSEHREHGMGASLVDTQPVANFEGVNELASQERWERLRPLEKAANVRTAVHVQASNRLDLLGQFLDLDDIGHLSRSGLTMLGFLLESPLFVDDTVRTMVSLNPRLTQMVERVRKHWQAQSPYGVRPGGMFSPPQPISDDPTAPADRHGAGLTHLSAS